MVYTYFLRDRTVAGAPNDIHGWDVALRETDAAVALPEEHPLADSIMRVFPEATAAPI